MSLGVDTIEEIEAKAETVLLDAFDTVDDIVPPINLGKVLKKYQLKLQPGTFQDPSIAGAYDQEDSTIYIDQNDPLPRTAFTVAHELGHYFLHKDKAEEVYYRQDALNLNEEHKHEEQEANWFAASLLMPRQLIRRFWMISPDVNQIARIFGVSPSAAYWRLKHLGLVKR